ncbi:hypothetical protein HDU76_009710 [Blyttiomyces sp. JEL0837]|nr:hypothetical protein HDU76_009710 [Blyttiomyces sp. JEL0837]
MSEPSPSRMMMPPPPHFARDGEQDDDIATVDEELLALYHHPYPPPNPYLDAAKMLPFAHHYPHGRHVYPYQHPPLQHHLPHYYNRHPELMSEDPMANSFGLPLSQMNSLGPLSSPRTSHPGLPSGLSGAEHLHFPPDLQHHHPLLHHPGIQSSYQAKLAQAHAMELQRQSSLEAYSRERYAAEAFAREAARASGGQPSQSAITQPSISITAPPTAAAPTTTTAPAATSAVTATSSSTVEQPQSSASTETTSANGAGSVERQSLNSDSVSSPALPSPAPTRLPSPNSLGHPYVHFPPGHFYPPPFPRPHHFLHHHPASVLLNHMTSHAHPCPQAYQLNQLHPHAETNGHHLCHYHMPPVPGDLVDGGDEFNLYPYVGHDAQGSYIEHMESAMEHIDQMEQAMEPRPPQFEENTVPAVSNLELSSLSLANSGGPRLANENLSVKSLVESNQSESTHCDEQPYAPPKTTTTSSEGGRRNSVKAPVGLRREKRKPSISSRKDRNRPTDELGGGNGSDIGGQGDHSGSPELADSQLESAVEGEDANDSEVATSSRQRKRRAQVKIACTHCKRACKKCDERRPCGRCIRLNLPDCSDAPRKERKKGFKRGPYQKPLKKDGDTDSEGALDYEDRHGFIGHVVA